MPIEAFELDQLPASLLDDGSEQAEFEFGLSRFLLLEDWLKRNPWAARVDFIPWFDYDVQPPEFHMGVEIPIGPGRTREAEEIEQWFSEYGMEFEGLSVPKSNLDGIGELVMGSGYWGWKERRKLSHPSSR